MNTFIDDFNRALHGDGSPPAAPDLTSFDPTTEEDYELIGEFMMKLKNIQEKAAPMLDRARTSLEAPLLRRPESVTAGRTLYDNI